MRAAELTMVIALLSAVDVQAATDIYASDHFELFVGAASHRPVDGLDYYDNNGVFLAGTRYAHSAGFYAATQVLHGDGDGLQMPATGVTNLESAVGWTGYFQEHGFSVDVQDYRLWSEPDNANHQALAVNYRNGAFHAELGYESDKPFHYAPLGRYFFYDNRRLAVSYRFPLGAHAGLQLNGGVNDISRIDLRYEYAAVQFDWRWQGLQWSVGYTIASDDVETFYSSAVDRDTVTLRVAAVFDIFRSLE